MLFYKRIATFFFLFINLSLLFFVGSLIGGGAIVGAMAATKNHATSHEQGAALGRAAGQQYGQKYGGIILLASGGLSLALSAALSFSSVLPWCRREG